ncbi:hypothetical protein, partial [uncultured Holdemanella sp.]|uniref:hypothetical protein n=1 Tax=uncultured Holdemanella sp. TaxID=1763549 RepID=UPI0025DB2299
MFNVQSAYTLFARQETQKIRKLSSGIRKLTDFFYIQCDKLEVVELLQFFIFTTTFPACSTSPAVRIAC